MRNKSVASVKEAFERALGLILTRVSVSARDEQDDPESHSAKTTTAVPLLCADIPVTRIAIAYSGGLDSSALLHLASDYAANHGIELLAFHVHHGISANADDWLIHCEGECARLGIRFDASRVTLGERNKSGVEEAARLSRYAALGTLCRKHKVSLLLTAHHLDDQAETVLLQLLRGSGVAGLSGMDTLNAAPDLFGDPELLMCRPLLSVSRIELAEFVVRRDISYVDDESNTDPRYARNALRHQVIPTIRHSFPGFEQRVMRSAQHAQSAQRLLDQLAAQDLAQCGVNDCIAIDRLKQLDTDRIDNVLRYWLGAHGVRMPATAWLSEMRGQLFDAREDACVRVVHADCEIRRYRDKIFITARIDEDSVDRKAIPFRWRGEQTLHFDTYGGSLHFEPAQDGVEMQWLLAQDLVIRYRQGGERLKPAANRPTRSLKHHYQALDIPPWERERLPLVSTILGELVFAAGIGVNWRPVSEGNAQHIRIRWSFDNARRWD